MLTDHCTGYTAFATGYIYSSLLSTLLGVPLEIDSFKLHHLGFLASGFSLGLAVGSSSERGQEEREEKVLSCSLCLAVVLEVAAFCRWPLVLPGISPSTALALTSFLITTFPLVPSGLMWQ